MTHTEIKLLRKFISQNQGIVDQFIDNPAKLKLINKLPFYINSDLQDITVDEKKDLNTILKYFAVLLARDIISLEE